MTKQNRQNGQNITGREELFTDGSMLLAVKALLDGAYDNGLFLRPEEAVGIAMSAALAFAIETGGRGREREALAMARSVFDAFESEYARQVADGRITGKSRGGFRRRHNRKMAGFGET